MPLNATVVGLLGRVNDLTTNLDLARAQLAQIQAACDHVYDTPRGASGDHCRVCYHWSPTPRPAPQVREAAGVGDPRDRIRYHSGGVAENVDYD